MLKKMATSLKAAFSVDMNLDKAAAGRVRASQLASMVHTKLFMMITNITSAGAVFYLLYQIQPSNFLIAWFTFLSIYSLLGIDQWWKTRKRVYKSTASIKGLQKTLWNCVTLGALWGSLPVMVYPNGDIVAQLVVVATGCGMMGGSAIALNKMPKSLVGLMVPLCLGLSAAFIMSGRPVDFAIMIMTICFSLSLIKGAIGISQNFVESRVALFENRRHAATIEMLLSDFSESSSDWLWETDSLGAFTRGKERFENHIGIKSFSFDPNTIPISAMEKITSADLRVRQSLWGHIQAGTPFKAMSFPVFSDGNAKWLSVSGKPIIDDDGNFTGYRGVASDITEMRKAEERIAFLAYNDALTGLVNRANFNAAAEACFANENQKWAVMYLDLDGFKQINDQYGHSGGDTVLVEVGKRLKNLVDENDTVARLGGDEFAIISKSAYTVDALSSIAEQVVAEIAKPFKIDAAIYEIGASIGIAIAGTDGTETEQLINNADLALYRAKAEGKSTYRFYEMEMDEVVKQRRALENDLREAVRNKELTLNFQPLVSSDNEAPTGFEALARWTHERHGKVSPSEFIPIAERIGVVSEIGDWVLHQACKEANTWPEEMTVAVNLSPQQFHDERIIDMVKWVLDDTGLDPKRLELEITESLFVENKESMVETLKKLKEMGVSIALDDFGTGYSSLSYLLKFPFDKLKIDRSLITSINEDETAREVLESIAKLGSILDLKVTAEGVETSDQVKLLKGMDCTHFQGYHFGRPLVSEDLPAFLLKSVVESAEDAEENEVVVPISKNRKTS